LRYIVDSDKEASGETHLNLPDSYAVSDQQTLSDESGTWIGRTAEEYL